MKGMAGSVIYRSHSIRSDDVSTAAMMYRWHPNVFRPCCRLIHSHPSI